MGLLTEGTPLSWEETKQYAQHVRHHGILQFINQYNKLKDRSNDCLRWGDEVSSLCILYSLYLPYYRPPFALVFFFFSKKGHPFAVISERTTHTMVHLHNRQRSVTRTPDFVSPVCCFYEETVTVTLTSLIM